MPSIPSDPIAAALRQWERRQEIAAHNLANVETTGFKAERPFARLLASASGSAERDAAAGPVLDAATDLRQGTLRPTGAPLDLAIDGPGFFVVGTPAGDRWTRGGAFSLDDTGRVVDGAGAPLLTADGPLVVPPSTVTLTVGPEGVVAADGRVMGRLRLEAPPAGTLRLEHEDGGYLRPTAIRQSLAGAGAVRQGMLEGSNVDPIGALVEMITIQRAYGAVGQAHATREAVEDKANELGKPV